jgi:hypothetical protein
VRLGPVDLRVDLRAQLGEPRGGAGGELVTLVRQVDREVLTDDGRRRGQDQDPLTQVDGLVDVVGDEQLSRMRSSRPARVWASTAANGSSISSTCGSQAQVPSGGGRENGTPPVHLISFDRPGHLCLAVRFANVCLPCER